MADIAYEDSSWHDSGLNVNHYFEMFAAAKTPVEQAQYLIELTNAMSDLRTWLPGYDIETDVVIDPRFE